MRGEKPNVAASIHGRLKNLAKDRGEILNRCYIDTLLNVFYTA
jgi:hypothetical protein